MVLRMSMEEAQAAAQGGRGQSLGVLCSFSETLCTPSLVSIHPKFSIHFQSFSLCRFFSTLSHTFKAHDAICCRFELGIEWYPMIVNGIPMPQSLGSSLSAHSPLVRL